ncbi:MAG: hypothetical protein K9L30_10095 [Desulfobacterales bacterium]|nr:hypothetical protein [Desulfobacterales bacterium]
MQSNIKQVLVIVLLCVGFLEGCARNEVTPDLVEYVNQGILKFSQLETDALQQYALVTGLNYTTDEAVFEALKLEVIPRFKLYLDLLRTIDPETDEVIALHSIYVYGVETMYNGFRVKKNGIENQDDSQIIAANRLIEEGRDQTMKWHNQLMEMYQSHGIKSDKK